MCSSPGRQRASNREIVERIRWKPPWTWVIPPLADACEETWRKVENHQGGTGRLL